MGGEPMQCSLFMLNLFHMVEDMHGSRRSEEMPEG